jgi:hypothetical protein
VSFASNPRSDLMTLQPQSQPDLRLQCPSGARPRRHIPGFR